MTLRGYFGASGRPHILAIVYFPRLAAGGGVEFLVDTGADASVLSLADAQRILQGKLGALTGDTDFGGVGGGLACFHEPGSLAFIDESASLILYDGVFIAKEDKVPSSLLGRDVLDRCAMTYDPTNARLVLEVRDSDGVLAPP